MKSFLPLIPMLESLVGPGSDYQDPVRRKPGHKDPPPKPTETIGIVRPHCLTWEQATQMLAELRAIQSAKGG